MTADQAATSLLYSGEFTDAATGQQYLRARFYDPSTGRFNKLDPWSGDTSSPRTLHKYAYVHNNPVGNIDPSGLFSIAGSLSGFSIAGSLRGLNSSSVFGALRAVNTTLDLVETYQTFTGILRLLSGTPDIKRQLRRLQNIANLNANSVSRDWTKFRGLNSSHYSAVVRHTVQDLPNILPVVTKYHRRRLARLASGRPATIVIGLPSLPGNFSGSRLLGTVGQVGRFKVALSTSRTGTGGSLFSIGVKFSGSSEIHSMFRLDYHGKGRPTERLGYPGSGNPRIMGHGHAELLGNKTSGIGPPIAGLGRTGSPQKPQFHWHVPFAT